MDYTGNVIYHWQLIIINKLISIYKVNCIFIDNWQLYIEQWTIHKCNEKNDKYNLKYNLQEHWNILDLG